MKKQKNEEIYNEELARQADLNKFNSITQSVKPRNQNQEHNVKREGTGPINQAR
jgi:hypothetical protein